MILKKCVVYTMLLSFSSQAVFAAPMPDGDITSANLPDASMSLAMPSAEDMQDATEIIGMYNEVCEIGDPTLPPAATSTAVVPRVSGSALATLKKYCDPNFLVSLVDPREIILPLTPRKAAFWIAYASIAAGLYSLNQYYYNYSDAIGAAIQYNSFILLGFIYGLEPLMLFFLLAAGHYPDANPLPPAGTKLVGGNLEADGSAQAAGTMSVNASVHTDLEAQMSFSQTEDTALVIPCHNSEEKIVKTLNAALKHFKPEQIFIIDNGNSPAPPINDKTKDVVKGIHPAINYQWLPLGNKNMAQYMGSVMAKNYKYILTTDDDVTLPDNFKAPVQMMNDEVKAATFAIEAVDLQNKKPLFVAWQDIEYKFSDLAKLTEGPFGGVLYPHGASSFWDRETFLKVLRIHDMIFYAEDVKLGLCLQKLGKRMAMDAGVSLATEVPESLIGEPLNYYCQRVRSWEMGRQSIYFKFLENVFALNGKYTVGTFTAQKSIQLYAVLSNTADWLKIPLFVVMGAEPQFWIKVAGFTAAPIIPLLLFKYLKLKHRPDITPGLPAVLTFPVYKVMTNITSILGTLRTLYYYWPNYKHKPTICELEKANDPRCIWLNNGALDGPGPELPTDIQMTEMREAMAEADISMMNYANTLPQDTVAEGSVPVTVLSFEDQRFNSPTKD